MRSVFSVSVEDVRLGNGGPPGRQAGSPETQRAATRFQKVRYTIKAAIGGAVRDIINAFWPDDCRLCGGPMISVRRVGVCDTCIASVQPQNEEVNPLCSRCGDALGMESARFAAQMGTSECTMCRLAPPEFARAVAYAEYDGEVRELLHLLKFNGVRQVATHLLGGYLAEAMLKLEPLNEPQAKSQPARDFIVIPVPLFAARQRSRGFNQAELLASSALKHLRKQHRAAKLRLDTTSLARIKDTRALFTMQPQDRRKNLRGAFRVVHADHIREREILLVDDIMTTGATARECARVLLRAGAAKVWVATVAKAQPESVSMRAVETTVARWDAPPLTQAEAQSSL